METSGDALKLARATRQKFRKMTEKEKLESWGENKRAGKYPKELEKEYIDKDASVEWLKKGVVKFDGERIIVGAQDQALYTRAFQKMIGKRQDDKCRFCKCEVESVGHLMSACEIMLAEGLYTRRHNSICSLLHWRLCKEYGIPTTEHH
jgi:hypothetical protein